MCTPPRHHDFDDSRWAVALFAIMAWANAAACGLAEPPGEVVLSGLSNPTGIAVRSAPRGTGVEIFVAEPGRILSTVWKDGEAAPPKAFIEGLPAEPTALGWLSKKTLLVASREIAAYQLPDEGPPANPLAIARAAQSSGQIRSVVANAHFVYAGTEKALLRSRHIGKRLTYLKAYPTKQAAVAISPLGYLVVLHVEQGDSESRAWRLAFLDPEHPDELGATLPITGLREPIQIAFAGSGNSSEAALHVLEAGGGEPGRGVYRLDSARSEAGRPAAVARRVRGVERPTAFAIGPDRACYVASTANGGQVIRFSLEVHP